MRRAVTPPSRADARSVRPIATDITRGVVCLCVWPACSAHMQPTATHIISSVVSLCAHMRSIATHIYVVWSVCVWPVRSAHMRPIATHITRSVVCLCVWPARSAQCGLLLHHWHVAWTLCD